MRREIQIIDTLKGIYLLRIQVEGSKLEIGCLGSEFLSGDYVYVGSAQGKGGFNRVKRYFRVSEQEEPTLHWHIDYLLAEGEIKEVWFLPTDKDLECRVARKLKDRLEVGVKGFGCSDCECVTHLFDFKEGEKEKVIKVFGEVEGNLNPVFFKP